MFTRKRSRTLLWVFRNRIDFMEGRDYLVLYDYPERLVDWFLPGFYYRVHNCHDLIKYIHARFWDGRIRIGGCLLLQLTKFNIAKIIIEGNLNDFRKTMYKFMTVKKPEKLILKLIKKAQKGYSPRELAQQQDF